VKVETLWVEIYESAILFFNSSPINLKVARTGSEREKQKRV
jgi:hypothetical protein